MPERVMPDQDNYSENQEKFMERMEFRDRNARIILSIISELTYDVPYLENDEDFDRVVNEKKQLVQRTLESTRGDWFEKPIGVRVKEIVERYFVELANARRVEISIKNKLATERRDNSPEEIGLEMFRQITNTEPIGIIRSERAEGYFVIVFVEDTDFEKFIGKDGLKRVGGVCTTIKFSNMQTGVLLIKEFVETRIQQNIRWHEKQHIINNFIFNNFIDIEKHDDIKAEEYPDLVQDLDGSDKQQVLRQVKDEIFARVRDLSSTSRVVDFFDAPIYAGRLRDPLSFTEQAELKSLLEAVKKELGVAYDLFDNPLCQINRQILIYHLIDIPLLSFPGRIREVVKFYKAKFIEFTGLMPAESDLEVINLIKDKDKINKLINLRLTMQEQIEMARSDISRDTYIGWNGAVTYEDRQAGLVNIKDSLKQMRGQYEALLKED